MYEPAVFTQLELVWHHLQKIHCKSSTEAEKKERARRRNEISALESRITKKIGEMQSHQSIFHLKKKLQILTNAVNETVD